MECPKCGGTGEMQICEMGFIGKDECDKCHGKGYLTNEEWFANLPTEEKAKFIFWQHFDVYGKTLYELMVNASRGVARDKQAEVMIGAVVEWLKQPHREE